MGNTKSENMKSYISFAIMFVIMFMGFFISSPALPAYGWQVLFIFLGLLFGWSVVGLIGPSLLGLVALALTDGFTIKSAWAAGLGAELIVLIILFSIFSKWMEDIGFTDTLVNWFLSKKAFYGKPWLFITCFFLIIFLLSFLTSIFPAIFIGWACSYKLCEVLGYEKRSKFCGFLVFNIAAIGTMGDSCKPWSVWGLSTMNVYNSTVIDGGISYASYMIWVAIVYLLALGLTILFGKFFWKIDMTPYMNGDYREAAGHYNFDNNQKFATALLTLMVVLLFLPGYLPACGLKTLLNDIGTIGIVSLILIIAMVVRRPDGTPHMNFKKLVNNGAVPWDPVMLLAITIPLGNAMKSSDAGLMQIVSNFAINYMNGMTPIIFYCVVAVFLGVVTQFTHNLVLLTSIVPVFMAVGASLGMSQEVIVMISSIVCSAALATPAASTRAGLLFGNAEYIDLKDCYILGWVSLLMHLIAVIAIGIPLGMLIL